jgi:hypothetical protein
MKTMESPVNLRRPLFAALAVTACVGCGSNAPEIPPELIEAIKASGSASGDYPEGPYGNEEGDIAQNLCFDQAWLDPKASNFNPAAFERVCFADFYDPDGDKGIELLMVNTGAVWCVACQVEWGGGGGEPSLSEHQRARYDRGFRVLGDLFEDAAENPATEENAVTWAKSFDVDFPFALDSTFKMGTFVDRSTQPFNMILDAKTMEILFAGVGTFPWELVDAELDDRSK